MLRKATGTAAALIAWKWPEAAVGGFLLWLYWEPLNRLAIGVWDDWMCARTEKALREDPNAEVEGFYVLMLSRRRRRERERQERFRQRWRSRLGSPRRALATLLIFLDKCWWDTVGSVSDKLAGDGLGEERWG